MNNLGDLEVFARMVSAGSMSAAGRELGLSPAVVSKRLRRLEDRLGTRLMNRTTRQISLTEAGQGFYERVVSILAGLEEAENFVSSGSNMARGTLKISAPTSFGRMHIAPHLQNFFELNPAININLNLHDDMTDIVGEGYDLAIRIAELKDSSLVARKLAPVKRVLCATPEYIEARGMPRNLDDLEDHICIPNHNSDTWRLEGDNDVFNFRPTGPIQTNSSEVVREAVLSGIGIALRSTWDIGDSLTSGKLQRVLPQYESSRHVAIHAVYASKTFLPLKVRLFIDYLADIYGNVPYWDQKLVQTNIQPHLNGHSTADAR